MSSEKILQKISEKDIKYHLVNTKDLWTKEEESLVLKNEVKQNSESEDMPF